MTMVLFNSLLLPIPSPPLSPLTQSPTGGSVVIRGHVGRWPGAPAADLLRQLRASSADAIQAVPSTRWLSEQGAVGAQFGGFLAAAEYFDNARFSVGPAEAAAMDPQQRLLLEVGRPHCLCMLFSPLDWRWEVGEVWVGWLVRREDLEVRGVRRVEVCDTSCKQRY